MGEDQICIVCGAPATGPVAQMIDENALQAAVEAWKDATSCDPGPASNWAKNTRDCFRKAIEAYEAARRQLRDDDVKVVARAMAIFSGNDPDRRQLDRSDGPYLWQLHAEMARTAIEAYERDGVCHVGKCLEAAKEGKRWIKGLACEQVPGDSDDRAVRGVRPAGRSVGSRVRG